MLLDSDDFVSEEVLSSDLVDEADELAQSRSITSSSVSEPLSTVLSWPSSDSGTMAWTATV
jgi:hypothetical protein